MKPKKIKRVDPPKDVTDEEYEDIFLKGED
jgi:hypothetical protein